MKTPKITRTIETPNLTRTLKIPNLPRTIITSAALALIAGSVLNPLSVMADSKQSLSPEQIASCLNINPYEASDLPEVYGLAAEIRNAASGTIPTLDATLDIGSCSFYLGDASKGGDASFFSSVELGANLIDDRGLDAFSAYKPAGKLDQSTLAAIVALELTGNGRLLADSGVISQDALGGLAAPSNLAGKLTLLDAHPEDGELMIAPFDTALASAALAKLPAEMLRYDGPDKERIERYNQLLAGNANVRAFFELLRAHEGSTGNGWNSMYPSTTFDNGYADHPQIPSLIGYGAYGDFTSDAAGLCQFLSSTWEPIQEALGLPDFQPINQAYACLYDLDSKHDVLDELEKGDIYAVLSKVGIVEWEGLNTSQVDEFNQYVQKALLFEDIISETFNLKPIASQESGDGGGQKDNHLAVLTYNLAKGSVVAGTTLESDLMIPVSDLEKKVASEFGINAFSANGKIIYIPKGSESESSTIKTVPIDSIPELDMLFTNQELLKTLNALKGSVKFIDETGKNVDMIDFNPYGADAGYITTTAITDFPLTPLVGQGIPISSEELTSAMISGGFHMGSDFSSMYLDQYGNYVYISDGSPADMRGMVAYFRRPQGVDAKVVVESWPSGYGENGIKITLGNYKGWTLELRIGHGIYYGQSGTVTDENTINQILAGFNSEIQDAGEWVPLARSGIEGAANNHPHYHVEVNLLGPDGRIYLNPEFFVEGYESTLEELIPKALNMVAVPFGYFVENPASQNNGGNAGDPEVGGSAGDPEVGGGISSQASGVAADSGSSAQGITSYEQNNQEPSVPKLSEYLINHQNIVSCSKKVCSDGQPKTGECNLGEIHAPDSFVEGEVATVYACGVDEDGSGRWINPYQMLIDLSVGNQEAASDNASGNTTGAASTTGDNANTTGAASTTGDNANTTGAAGNANNTITADTASTNPGTISGNTTATSSDTASGSAQYIPALLIQDYSSDDPVINEMLARRKVEALSVPYAGAIACSSALPPGLDNDAIVVALNGAETCTLKNPMAKDLVATKVGEDTYMVELMSGLVEIGDSLILNVKIEGGGIDQIVDGINSGSGGDAILSSQAGGPHQATFSLLYTTPKGEFSTMLPDFLFQERHMEFSEPYSEGKTLQQIAAGGIAQELYLSSISESERKTLESDTQKLAEIVSALPLDNPIMILAAGLVSQGKISYMDPGTGQELPVMPGALDAAQYRPATYLINQLEFERAADVARLALRNIQNAMQP